MVFTVKIPDPTAFTESNAPSSTPAQVDSPAGCTICPDGSPVLYPEATDAVGLDLAESLRCRPCR